ncbi:interferon-inducible GTPase 5-like, partial [Paramuricea clavata]
MTDVIGARFEPACYTFPDNPEIVFTELTGIGTPSFPNLQIYCKNFSLETYDTFLILTSTRFTYVDLHLAQKIKSMGKSFFLIRTKIDLDAFNEKRKKRPDKEKMLRMIRADLYKNVKDLGIREDEIFLISNYETDRWDFKRLVEAILEKLSTGQKEALTLSLKILSHDVERKNVDVLK